MDFFWFCKKNQSTAVCALYSAGMYATSAFTRTIAGIRTILCISHLDCSICTSQFHPHSRGHPTVRVTLATHRLQPPTRCGWITPQYEEHQQKTFQKPLAQSMITRSPHIMRLFNLRHHAAVSVARTHSECRLSSASCSLSRGMSPASRSRVWNCPRTSEAVLCWPGKNNNRKSERRGTTQQAPFSSLICV